MLKEFNDRTAEFKVLPLYLIQISINAQIFKHLNSMRVTLAVVFVNGHHLLMRSQRTDDQVPVARPVVVVRPVGQRVLRHRYTLSAGLVNSHVPCTLTRRSHHDVNATL